MTDLVTLSGTHNYHFKNSRLNRRSTVHARNEELMGGLLDFIKDSGSALASPFVAVGKGIGHVGMEAYRGVQTGDPLRVLKAPFKGAGHIAIDYSRSIKEYSEYYWRPSKMKDWMKPIGASILAIGSVPSPLSILFIPLGTALVLGGTIGESVYINDQIKKAEDLSRLQSAEDQKKANYVWYGVAAVGVVGAILIFT